MPSAQEATDTEAGELFAPRSHTQVNSKDAPVRHGPSPSDPFAAFREDSLNFPSHFDSYARRDCVNTLVSDRWSYTNSRFCIPVLRRKLHGLGHIGPARTFHR